MKQPWTPPELRRLRRLLVVDGHSTASAADVLGRSPASVRWAARTYDIPRPGLPAKFSAAQWARIDALILECLDLRGMPGRRVTRHLRALGFDIGETRVNQRIHELGPEARRLMRENAQSSQVNRLARNRQRQAIRQRRLRENSHEGINSSSETTKARRKDGPSTGRKVLQAP